MELYIKFQNGDIASPFKINDIETILQVVKQAKLGRDNKKEFNLHIQSTGEYIVMNHDQIKSIEVVFED